MAFKMKSGSPFHRNFGVGESPVKQASPMKDTKTSPDNGNALEADKRHKATAAHHTGPLPMESPVKDLGKYIGDELVDDAAYEDHMKNIENKEQVGYGSDTTLRDTETGRKMTDRFMKRSGRPTYDEWLEEEGKRMAEFRTGPNSDVSAHQNFTPEEWIKYVWEDRGKGEKYNKSGDLESKYYLETVPDKIKDRISDSAKKQADTARDKVTLTGQDFIDDIEKRYEEATGKRVPSVNTYEYDKFQKWMREEGYGMGKKGSGGKWPEKYEEAKAFIRSGDEDPETLTEYRQNLADQ